MVQRIDNFNKGMSMAHTAAHELSTSRKRELLVKAMLLGAVLLASEAGCEVSCDRPPDNWRAVTTTGADDSLLY